MEYDLRQDPCVCRCHVSSLLVLYYYCTQHSRTVYHIHCGGYSYHCEVWCYEVTPASITRDIEVSVCCGALLVFVYMIHLL